MHEGFSDVLPLPTPPLLSLWHGLSISASFLVQLNFPVCQLSILWWSFLVSQGSVWTQAQLFFSSLYAATLSVSGTAPVLSWNIWTGKKLLNRLTEMYLMLFNTQDGSCMEKLVTRVILAQSSTRTVLNWRICWPLLGTLSFSFHRFFSWVGLLWNSCTCWFLSLSTLPPWFLNNSLDNPFHSLHCSFVSTIKSITKN